MTAVLYRDEVLEPIVSLYTAVVGPAVVYMDDNARLDRAHVIDEYLASERIAKMDCPAYSSDVNPII